MNRQATQFWVALIGILGITVVTAISVIATMFYDAPAELAFMFAGGLLSIGSAAGAWLFRLNGSAKNGGGG